jgi:Protein of unknown function (DUF3311)
MTSPNTRGRVTGLVFNPWNLVLLLPFIILLTPIYNQKTPEFIGMPFFYWFQFLIIALGVASTITVYRMTRKVPAGQVKTGPTVASAAVMESTAEPDVAEPAATEPEAAEPAAAEPVAAEPEAAEPEPEPDAAEPDDAKTKAKPETDVDGPDEGSVR